MLSGVIQVQKDKGCMFSLICGRQIWIQIQALIRETEKERRENMFPKVRLLEQTKRGEKEGKNGKSYSLFSALFMLKYITSV
jgi:hypothetical protein